MSTKPKPIFHITRLAITNYGIIQAAAIHPDGSPVILAGDNGAGKSTVLAGIESLLFGRRLAEPVTKGKEKANLKLELAEAGTTKPIYRIEQIIKAGEKGEAASYNLKITDADGKQVPSPVKFIESLIQSGAALDPTEIMQAKPGERPDTFAKRQAEILMERMGLTAKAKKLDAEIEAKSAERKKAKDDVADLQGRLDAIEVPPGTPDALVDVAELGSRITEYNNLKNSRDGLATKVNSALEAHQRAEQDVAKAEKALEEAKAKRAAELERHKGATQMLEAFDDLNPPAGVQDGLNTVNEMLQNANAINAAVQKKQERKKLSTELAQAEADASNFNSEVEALKEQRLDLVRKVKLPVEGLKLTPEALLFNGKPLVQESTGNQIRVCSELAMSEEPACRVIFIREGALTNSKNRQIIYNVAEQKGWQVWEEHFSEVPMDGALWIEGGKVKE